LAPNFLQLEKIKPRAIKLYLNLGQLKNKKGVEIFLHRGKLDPLADAHGILNTVHARILAALKNYMG